MGGVDGAKTLSSSASVRSSQMGMATSLNWMLNSKGTECERFKGQPSQVGTCP